MKNNYTIGMLAAVALLFAACGKYEDGPAFSLLTKKQRLCREWDAKSYVYSNGTTFEDNNDAIISFEKSGSVTLTDDGVGISGTWEFNSDKDKLNVTTSFFEPPTSTATIMRLTNKELWLKDSDGDVTKYEAK